MKNLTFLAGLIFLSGLTGASAAPYIGLDGNFGSLALNASDPVLYQQSATGTSFHLGDRFGLFAGEIGYGSSTATGGVNGDGLHLDQATVDGIFYVPILGNFNVAADGQRRRNQLRYPAAPKKHLYGQRRQGQNQQCRRAPSARRRVRLAGRGGPVFCLCQSI